MARNRGLVVLATMLAIILVLSPGSAWAQNTTVSKTITTSTGEMKVKEGEFFTVNISGKSVGSRFWAVLDILPAGFQIEDANFGASGVTRTLFQFDETSVVFVAESENINKTSKVTITYRALASRGGTYIIFGAIGYIFNTFEGFVPVTRSEPIRSFQVISQTSVELGEAVKRLDSLEARVSRALAENTLIIQKLKTDLEAINKGFSDVKEQLKAIQTETNSKFQLVQSSIEMVDSSQKNTAQALRAEINDVRASLSQEVQTLGIAATVFAAAATVGVWLQVVRSKRGSSSG